jgi:hypothetical protein
MAVRHIGPSATKALERNDPYRREQSLAVILEAIAQRLDKLEVVRVVAEPVVPGPYGWRPPAPDEPTAS